jgi:hypothetical protein
VADGQIATNHVVSLDRNGQIATNHVVGLDRNGQIATNHVVGLDMDGQIATNHVFVTPPSVMGFARLRVNPHVEGPAIFGRESRE